MDTTVAICHRKESQQQVKHNVSQLCLACKVNRDDMVAVVCVFLKHLHDTGQDFELIVIQSLVIPESWQSFPCVPSDPCH